MLRPVTIAVSLAATTSAACEASGRDVVRVLWSVPLKSHCFGGGAAADVNGDGACDIAFATYFGDARVHVLSGKNGHEIWSYHDADASKDSCYDASCRFLDAEGDGKLELVVPCSSDSRVILFDADVGTVKWSTYLGGGECIDTPPWVGDADGDGAFDIVVGTFKTNLHVLCAREGKIKRTLRVSDSGAVQSCPIVMDLNADGARDFIAGVFARNKGGLFAIDGKTGERLWAVETKDSVYHGPAIGRIGEDGAEALVFGAYDGQIRFIRPRDGAVIKTIDSGNRYVMAPLAIESTGKTIGNDKSGRERAIYTADGYGMIDSDWTLDGPVPVSKKKLDTCSRGVAIADLNGDGERDWAYLTSKGVFRVVNGRHVTEEFDAGALLGDGEAASENSHCPTLADFDGDGRLDAFIVVGGGGERQPDGSRKPFFGRAQCLTGFQGEASQTNGWYMFRHDSNNTGNVRTPLDPAVRRAIPGKER